MKTGCLPLLAQFPLIYHFLEAWLIAATTEFDIVMTYMVAHTTHTVCHPITESSWLVQVKCSWKGTSNEVDAMPSECPSRQFSSLMLHLFTNYTNLLSPSILTANCIKILDQTSNIRVVNLISYKSFQSVAYKTHWPYKHNKHTKKSSSRQCG